VFDSLHVRLHLQVQRDTLCKTTHGTASALRGAVESRSPISGRLRQFYKAAGPSRLHCCACEGGPAAVAFALE